MVIVRDWMKAIMKATIDCHYTSTLFPFFRSGLHSEMIVCRTCHIIMQYSNDPAYVCPAMNPAPRPPSPSARDATQKALRRENPHQLSGRDARVLMGLPSTYDG